MTFEQSLLTTPPATWKTDQAVIFDWYDGPREGVCRLSVPSVEFRFRLLDERASPDGLDDRLLRLEELPAGTVADLCQVLRPLGKPMAPIWIPVWQFQSAEEQHATEALLAHTEKHARLTSVAILTSDLLDFRGCWDLTGRTINGANWFSLLKITGTQLA